MQRKLMLIIGVLLFILLGSDVVVLLDKQNTHKLIDTALVDFQTQPSREKMKALKTTYESLSAYDQRLYDKVFSIVETRFKVAERTLYLKQWALYDSLYEPLDEGYFIAFVKQYQDLIRYEAVLHEEYNTSSSENKVYHAMLNQIQTDVLYGLSLKERIDEILSAHPLTKKQIEDMPFIPVTSWIDVHNREVPEEIKISIQ